MSVWTVTDIPPQQGRRALITGANSGIGYYAALELARRGAHVLLAARDRTRGEAALARLRREAPEATAELILLNLADLASVRGVSERLLAEGHPLDLLIHNAGVMAPPKRLTTVDGFELQFGTNVLGHFALTANLMPLLQRAAGTPRIVTLASIAHKAGRIDFDDLMGERHYSPMGRYQQSKLADLIFAFELDRRLRAAGSPIRSVAAHPGVANTNLFHSGEFPAIERAVRRLMGSLIDRLLNTVPGGAVPTLYAATAPEAVGGGYYGPQGFLEMRGGDVGPAKIAASARDAATAVRLWQRCEELTGLRLLHEA
jgi:NAD(P)-dependent dehydrogenase (short-subunit alcohol dehydrogenase family)